MNPEPLLNKTVKQYLSNAKGKLLFSLVREFLEYFGLEYTISVFDPETYFGKEYNYVGRNKLSEALGINSNEPLLGEILKNSINGAFSNIETHNANHSKHEKIGEASNNFANTTYDVSVSNIMQNESISFSNDNDLSEKLESPSEQSPQIPINVTITEKKKVELTQITASDNESHGNSLRENINENHETKEDNADNKGNNNLHFEKNSENLNKTITITNHLQKETETEVLNQTASLNKTEPLIKFDVSISSELQTNQSPDITKQNNKNSLDLQISNNVQNKKPVSTGNNFGKTVYFEEIIIDGRRGNISTMHNAESCLNNASTLEHNHNSIFGDLPPLNGKKANINDLKELINIGLSSDGVDNYDEDFVSSASGSANEQSPFKDLDTSENPTKLQMKKDDKTLSAHSEEISEEIEGLEEILTSTSCNEDLNIDKNISNFTSDVNTDCIEEV
ncbi:homeobox protein 3-like [Prorops nasuta]|uniref:homeobox protein 3-like n=1 Tax=Prorops nasuta TaxID=863751 RepID=UPI0034CF8F97